MVLVLLKISVFVNQDSQMTANAARPSVLERIKLIHLFAINTVLVFRQMFVSAIPVMLLKTVPYPFVSARTETTLPHALPMVFALHQIIARVMKASPVMSVRYPYATVSTHLTSTMSVLDTEPVWRQITATVPTVGQDIIARLPFVLV